MDIGYDLFKAEANWRKHRVSFEEAASAFSDPNALAMPDAALAPHTNEQRWILLGLSDQLRLLTVVYTYRDENIRIVSARKATRHEAKSYA